MRNSTDSLQIISRVTSLADTGAGCEPPIGRKKLLSLSMISAYYWEKPTSLPIYIYTSSQILLMKLVFLAYQRAMVSEKQVSHTWPSVVNRRT